LLCFAAFRCRSPFARNTVSVNFGDETLSPRSASNRPHTATLSPTGLTMTAQPTSTISPTQTLPLTERRVNVAQSDPPESAAPADRASGSIPPCLATAAFARALHAVLVDLYTALRGCTQHQYRAPAGAALMGATLGGHVRHVLDHITPLFGAADALDQSVPVINYDLRERGTPIECDLSTALGQLAHTIARLSRPLPEVAPRLTVALMPAATEPAVHTRSSFERELAFALSHTIHHCATIRGILTELNLSFPDTLGYAPSTIRQLQSGAACAH
jgi:hypothetical protein